MDSIYGGSETRAVVDPADGWRHHGRGCPILAREGWVRLVIEVSGSHPSKTTTDGAAGARFETSVEVNFTIDIFTINIKIGGQQGQTHMPEN